MNRKFPSLPQKAWFHWHQPLLLRMANTRYGREILCIEDAYPEITKMLPGMVQARLGEVQWVSDFRTHHKWGKVILHRWKEFKEYQTYLQRREDAWIYRRAERLGIPVVGGAAETTFHPDPDPEVSSVDGYAQRTTDAVFGTLRDGNGTFFNDTEGSSDIPHIQAADAGNPDWYFRIRRGRFVFDTSTLPDSDIIDAAIISIKPDGFLNTLLGESSDNSKMHWCAGNGGSDTAVASADYQAQGDTSFGSTPNNQSAMLVGVYQDTTLEANGRAHISTTGVSDFGCRYGWDIDNLVPHDNGCTWLADANQRIRTIMADRAGTADDPKLVVTHSEAAADLPSYGQVIFNSADEESRPRYGQRIARGTEE